METNGWLGKNLRQPIRPHSDFTLFSFTPSNFFWTDPYLYQTSLCLVSWGNPGQFYCLCISGWISESYVNVLVGGLNKDRLDISGSLPYPPYPQSWQCWKTNQSRKGWKNKSTGGHGSTLHFPSDNNLSINFSYIGLLCISSCFIITWRQFWDLDIITSSVVTTLFGNKSNH